MKNLLFGLIATVLFAFNGNAQSSCSTNCLFGECKANCDKSTTASCSCIIGIFSSCKCSQKVVSIASSDKQRENADKVIVFLKENFKSELSESIILTISALQKGDLDNYYSNLDNVIVLIDKFPEEVNKIKEYVESLK